MSDKIRRRRRRFDEEFKRGALKMIDNGEKVRNVAENLGIREQQLYQWRSERKTSASAVEREVIELRAKNRQLEMERDILKKALSIFSRGG